MRLHDDGEEPLELPRPYQAGAQHLHQPLHKQRHLAPDQAAPPCYVMLYYFILYYIILYY